eukprot:Hpha_TRINITY_DN296_c0_g1::TRINITY_DN296_c0_g1_i1::g.83512::m.83512
MMEGTEAAFLIAAAAEADVALASGAAALLLRDARKVVSAAGVAAASAVAEQARTATLTPEAAAPLQGALCAGLRSGLWEPALRLTASQALRLLLRYSAPTADGASVWAAARELLEVEQPALRQQGYALQAAAALADPHQFWATAAASLAAAAVGPEPGDALAAVALLAA